MFTVILCERSITKSLFTYKVNVEVQLLHVKLQCPWSSIVTGRNEVVAKVIFLHLFVILFTGGGGGGIPEGTEADPPGLYPPSEQTPPQTRHTPRANTPRTRPPGSRPLRDQTPLDQTPPEQTPAPPPRKQTPAYGLRAAGTHSSLTLCQ